ncbi:MAG: hypothetical protein RR865_13615 [Clostridia bacterium]
MKTIAAGMHRSRCAKAPHPVLLIDGVPLEMWAKGLICSDALGTDSTDTLVPAQGWLIGESDLQNAWYLLTPKDQGSSTIVPIMICPDDMDMSCTVGVVEQKIDAQTVSWLRIGRATDVLNGVVVSVAWEIPNQQAVFDRAAFCAAVDELKRLTDEEWK